MSLTNTVEREDARERAYAMGSQWISFCYPS
jgi:hypothetical protein